MLFFPRKQEFISEGSPGKKSPARKPVQGSSEGLARVRRGFGEGPAKRSESRGLLAKYLINRPKVGFTPPSVFCYSEDLLFIVRDTEPLLFSEAPVEEVSGLPGVM